MKKNGSINQKNPSTFLKSASSSARIMERVKDNRVEQSVKGQST